MTENKEKIQEFKIADRTNFNQLYVIKGKPGIFIFISENGKSKLVTFRDWSKTFDENNPPVTVLRDNVVPLAHLQFITTDKKTIQVPKLDKNGKVISIKTKHSEEGVKDYEKEDKEIDVVLSIKDVFNNFHEYEKTLNDNIAVEDLELTNIETTLSLMDIAVPNFDPEKFRNYHLKKVIKYYVWFKQALINFGEFQDKITKQSK